MSNSLELKQLLFNKCLESINQRIETIEQVLQSIEESRNNETKSSVGDKHETGRAMMQIEEEKSRNQLKEASQVKRELLKIELNNRSDKIGTGNLVKTSNGVYFISIGIGKINLQNTIYYCVSVASPIGMKLMNKLVGDQIDFNGNQISIEEIA